MPNAQALQIFYGTIPFIAVVAWSAFQQRMLLKSILDRLSTIEMRVTHIEHDISKIKERLVALENRAGVIYHE